MILGDVLVDNGDGDVIDDVIDDDCGDNCCCCCCIDVIGGDDDDCIDCDCSGRGDVD